MSAAPSETSRSSLHERIEPATGGFTSILTDQAVDLSIKHQFTGIDLSELTRVMTKLVGGQRDETGETSADIPLGRDTRVKLHRTLGVDYKVTITTIKPGIWEEISYENREGFDNGPFVTIHTEVPSPAEIPVKSPFFGSTVLPKDEPIAIIARRPTTLAKVQGLYRKILQSVASSRALPPTQQGR